MSVQNTQMHNVSSTAASQSTTSSTQDLGVMIGAHVLGDYDLQIADFTGDMEASLQKKSALNSFKGEVSAHMNATKTFSKEQITALASLSQNKLVKDDMEEGVHIKLTSSQFEDLKNTAKELGIPISELKAFTDGKTHFVSQGRMENLKNAIEERVGALNSQSELKMIKYQSLLDARKQALMMLSNTINNDNQTKMAIINNMKG